MATGWTLPDSDRLLSLAGLQDEIDQSSMGLLDVMGVLARRAQLLTNSDGATIQLLDSGESVCCIASGITESMLGAHVPQGAGLEGACLAANEIIRSDDLFEDLSGDADWGRSVEVLSAMCSPLQLNGELVGVVKVVSRERDAYSDEDAGTLRAVTRFISEAMFQTILPDLQQDDGPRDPITHLGGRVLYEQRLAIEADRANRYGRPLSLVLLKLDGYYDSVLLRDVANLVRGVDECFVIGAGEFAIVMPDTPKRGAEIAAERVRTTLRKQSQGSIKVETGVAESDGPDASALHTAASAVLALPRVRSLAT